ncbi:MAG: head GIN domain-containing protein [Bacteroidales bacterium]
MKRNRFLKSAIFLFVALILVNINSYAFNVYQQIQERKLPAFNELNLSIKAEVYVKQGSTQKVEIQASEKYLKLLETEVKGNSLNIKWSEWNLMVSEKIKIFITMTDVNALKVSGSGDIYAQGVILTTDIDLAVSGSGKVQVDDLKAENISSSISGSGDILINGTNTAGKLNASISGSGNIKAQDLPVRNVEVAISGSGDCNVNAVENLRARISGSGDVYYKGRAVIDGKISGSGSIKHVD